MLKRLPESFAATRDALHRVAEELVAPARKPHNEIALRQTPGGFGTPEFEFEGWRTQVRVERDELVLARNGDEDRAVLTSVAAGGALLGPALLPDGVPDDDSRLGIDPDAADRLADFYAFAAEALARVKLGLAPDDDLSDTNLWPEHFDIAFEAGPATDGRRATYGASPGMATTPSRTCTSARGALPRTASSGMRPRSTGRRWATPSCSPRMRRSLRPSSSCGRATTR